MSLRLLDPVKDLELFREAYSWRSRPKKHAQPDRLPFEDFAAENPFHIVIGVFDEDEFVAAFLLWEYEAGQYEAHFTSRRHVDRTTLITAGHEIIRLFFENGARVITAWIIDRNSALRRFVADLGFEEILTQEISCETDTDCPRLPADAHPARVFVQYAITGGSSSV